MRPVSTTTAVLAAGCLSLQGAPPAQAAVPHVGQPCSMQASDQASPGVQRGTVQAGPVFFADTGWYAIRCSVQLWSDDHAAPDAASVTGQAGAPAELPASPVQFQAPRGASVYLCTEYIAASGSTDVHDADPAQPGDQCRDAQRAEAPGHQDYTVREDQMCVFPGVPDPRTRVCVAILDDIWTLGGGS